MSLTASEGQALAQKVRAWLRASNSRHTGPELGAFIDDLESVQNLNEWAGVDFERILPMRYRRQRSLALLSVVRNVLVFLPILLTWWALRHASQQFADRVAELRASGGEASVNFLEFWQNLDGLAQLSTVAMWDTIFIGSLIILTMFIGLSESISGRQDKLEQLHDELMVALDRRLSGFRYLTVADLNSAVEGTVSALLASSRQIELATRALSGAAADAFSAIEGVQQVTAQTFGPLVLQLESTVKSLAVAGQSHLDMTELVSNNRDQLAAQLDATRLGLADIVRQVDQGSKRMIDSAEAQLRTATNAIAATAAVVAHDLATSTSRELTGVGATIHDAAQSLRAGFERVGDSMEEASERMRATFATLEYGIQQIREDLEAISGGLGGAASR